MGLAERLQGVAGAARLGQGALRSRALGVERGLAVGTVQMRRTGSVPGPSSLRIREAVVG